MAEEFDDGFEGTRRRQAKLGLRMTHLQRLRWLEEKRNELLRLLGRARPPRVASDPTATFHAAGRPSDGYRSVDPESTVAPADVAPGSDPKARNPGTR